MYKYANRRAKQRLERLGEAFAQCSAWGDGLGELSVKTSMGIWIRWCKWCVAWDLAIGNGWRTTLRCRSVFLPDTLTVGPGALILEGEGAGD